MKYKVLKKQNSSKTCLVCGVKNDLGLKARFYQLENGELASIFNSKEFHQSYPGRVHGGISAAILDETIGRAISVSDETVWGVTGSLELRYKKPVPIDCDLITVARVTRELESYSKVKAKLSFLMVKLLSLLRQNTLKCL